MRKTKLAMLQSVVALILCAAMLVGTTFAWFTDEVASAVNKIQAGTLDVDLVDAAGNSLEGTSLTFMDVTGNTDILWEPGCTFKTQGFRVANRGSLALEYTMYINGLLGDSKLLEVIRFSVQDADGYTVDIDTFEGQLSARASSDVFYLVGHMDENAGNEYMNLTLTGIGITVYATQAMEENDSFGPEYDKDAFFPGLDAPILGSVNITTENDLLTADAYIDVEGAKVTIPAGTRVKPGTTTLKLRVKLMDETTSDVKLSDNQVLQPMDVTVEGVSDDNQVPLTVELYEIAPVGLNMGSIALHHVHDGTTVTMTRVAADAAFTADNQYRYDPATGDLALHMATFSEVAVVADTDNAWEGKFDYTWYDASKTELTIANADQLAAFGAIVGGMKKVTDRVDGKYTYSDEVIQDSFEGKTIKLVADINIGDTDSENGLVFYPIGYWNNEETYERKPLEERTTAVSSGLRNFEGTFDGNGHTVSNFYQNTWEMKGDHDWYDPIKEQYYRDGMGLFGRVYKGTVKNLTIKNFSSDGEITTTGCVAAYADGATFENIAIFNCNPRVYNIGNGGIVGCVGWYAKEANLKTTFTNITVDNSNKISALWGSYDVACGGIVGQYYPTSGQTSAGTPKNGGIHFENCHVSAVMDVYNDVCANYQYYAYRYTGMLIGSVRENETINGHVYPKMDKITAEDCTVHFGTWNDYYYCEIIDNTTASYTHDYQMSRLTEIKAIDGTTITYLDGTTGTVPASGRANYVIVDYSKGHGTENATCYHFKDGAVWTHEMGGIQTGIDENGDGQDDLKEDKQHIYLEFNNLVTGYGWGVTTKGVGDLAGVTILDREVGNSVVKFEKADTAKDSYMTEKTITIGELFKQAKWDDTKLTILNAAVNVTVSPVGEGSTVSGKFERNTSDWTKSTLTFSGTGAATITITDYYFCTATTISVTITPRTAEEKFDVVMNNGDFLHRVGNVGTVALGKLFAAKSGASIGNVSVTVEPVNGTAASGTYTSNATWTNGTIQFSGTGVVKVSITDNEYCTPTELILEVVDATNVTGLSGTISGNVVLLNDCGLSSLTVSGRNTVYGNGFTATYTGNGQYLNNGLKQGVVTVSENGTLDNLRIKASIYPSAYLYYSEAQNGPKDVEGTKNRYHYQLSSVAASGNATISNCYIYGGRTNIYIGDGNVTVKDSVLECGTLANVQIISSNAYSVSFEDVTTIQHQVKATVGDTNKVMLGAGIIVGDGDKDNKDATAPTLVLKGNFKQYNWVNADDKNAVSDSNAKMIISGALDATQYNHTINGKAASNLGIIYMNDFEGDFKNETGLPYEKGTVGLTLSGITVSRTVYSLKNAKSDQIYSDHTNADKSTVNGLYQPQFKYDSTLGDQYIAKTDDGDEFCYREGDIIYVLFPSGDTKELDLAKFVNIAKYTGQNLGLTITCKDSQGNAVAVNGGKIALSTADEYTVTYTATDTLFYDETGNKVTDTKTYSWDVVVEVSLKDTGIPNAFFEFDTSKQVLYYNGNSNRTQFIPFLAGLKIYDYHPDGTKYLRFDGDSTEDIYSRIQSVECTNNADAKRSEITLVLSDGGVLKVALYPRATSGGSTYSGSVKVADNVLYFVNGGTTSAKGQQWLIYGYSIVGNSGVEINSGELYFGKAGTDATSKSKPSNNFDPNGGNSGGSGCVTGDTLVTLADGTQKRIDSLTGAETLLVWDFYKGAYTVVPAALVINHGTGYWNVIQMEFEDGTVVNAVSAHAFFDADLNEFVMITPENTQEYVGHSFVKATENGYTTVKLVKCTASVQYTSSYSLVSAHHYNFIVEDMFSMTNLVPDLIAGLEIGENMKYDEATLAADIAQYGLYTYDDFADYITEAQFNAFNGAYLKISVGKGYITYEEIVELIISFVNN